MKKFLVPFALMCAAVISTPLLAAKPAATEPSVPEDVAEMLQFMREEEKLAHDVYALFDRMYGEETNTFRNITASEQRHTDAVKALLDKYGVEDLAIVEDGELVEGEFDNPALQDLYIALVAVGEQGLTEALTVGVTIERKDIDDIGDAIEISTDYVDIVQVYSNLLAASGNHLEGFLRALGEKTED